MESINFGDFIVELNTTNPALRIRRKGTDASGIFLDVDTDGNLTFWNGNDYKRITAKELYAKDHIQLSSSKASDDDTGALNIYVKDRIIKLAGKDSDQESIRLCWDYENKILTTEPLRSTFTIRGASNGGANAVDFIIDFYNKNTSFVDVT